MKCKLVDNRTNATLSLYKLQLVNNEWGHGHMLPPVDNTRKLSPHEVFFIPFFHAESSDLPAHNGMSIIYINKQITIRSRIFHFYCFGMYFD